MAERQCAQETVQEHRRYVIEKHHIIDRFDRGKYLILEGTLPPPPTSTGSIEINGVVVPVRKFEIGRLGRIGVQLWSPL